MFPLGGIKVVSFVQPSFEVLHTLLLGIVKYSLKSLYNYQCRSRDGTLSKIFNKVEFERRVRIISNASKRQSDRTIPRAVFNTGVTSLSGIQGEEYIGLSMLTIAALPGMLNSSILEKKFAKLFWMGMSLHSCLSRAEFPKTEISENNFQKKVIKYVNCFVNVCGSQRRLVSPTVGCKLQKLHGLTHFHNQIERYGSAENSNWIYLKSHLKKIIKQP